MERRYIALLNKFTFKCLFMLGLLDGDESSAFENPGERHVAAWNY